MHLEVHPASRFEARACTPQHTYTPIYPTSSLEAKGVRILEPLTKSRRFYHVNHAGEVTPAKALDISVVQSTCSCIDKSIVLN